MNNIRQKYLNEAVPVLSEKLATSNPLAIPRLVKVSVSMGFGSKASDRKHIDESLKLLALITGQSPSITKAKKAVSGFRLRAGMEIGCRVTLRNRRMYDFMDRLIGFSLPRVRDFRGLSESSFDGAGNYSFGVSEASVFPEISSDEVHISQGLNVTIVTTAKDDELGRLLLRSIGFPFAK